MVSLLYCLMANCIQTADAMPKSSTNSFAQYNFTDEDTTNMPKLEGPPTCAMDNIEITQSGKTKLLSELNADKASGLMSFQIYSA